VNDRPAIVAELMRSSPRLLSTLMTTVALPVPLAEPRWIQLEVVDADHAHPLVAVTPTDTRPPLADTLPDVALRSNRHGAASCAIVMRWSLTAIDAERVEVSVFDATVTVTDASPCPDAGATSAHDASLDAVHAHSRAALTERVTRPPDAGSGEPEGPTVV